MIFFGSQPPGLKVTTVFFFMLFIMTFWSIDLIVSFVSCLLPNPFLSMGKK